MNIEGKIEDCCGCGICSAVCPTKAIKIIKDFKGFDYPVVDKQRCIDCSKCTRFCDFRKQKDGDENIESVYALQHKDDYILKESSSGGAFTAISDYILSIGGVVVGAVIDNNDFCVKHVCGETNVLRDRMRGSKYVQSSLKEVLPDIKKYIDEEKLILFSGTPCQCAAIRSLFRNFLEQFVFIDLVCHGAMAPVLLQENVRLWEKKKNNRAIDYKFRDKKFGWEHTHTIIFSNNKHYSSIKVSQLIKLHSISMRPSCYHCKYASKKREGDITIGDFWEANKDVGICDHKGTSFITVNSDKGKDILNKVIGNVKLIPLTHNHIRQNAFFSPVKEKETIRKFWDEYNKNGYCKALNKFAPIRLRSYVYQSLWRILYILGLDRFVTYLLSKR